MSQYLNQRRAKKLGVITPEVVKSIPKMKASKSCDKKLWKAFSEYIRLRDADANGMCSCITCNLIRHWKQMDCGHGIGRQHWGTRYNEKNNHAQCKRCNGFEGGKREIYKQKVDQKYGAGTWDLLELASKKSKRLSQFEIDQLEKYYKGKVKEFGNVKRTDKAA